MLAADGRMARSCRAKTTVKAGGGGGTKVVSRQHTQNDLESPDLGGVEDIFQMEAVEEPMDASSVVPNFSTIWTKAGSQAS